MNRRDRVRRVGDVVIVLAMLSCLAYFSARPSFVTVMWSLWFATFWWREVREASYAGRSQWVNGLDRLLLAASCLAAAVQCVLLLVRP
jgi:hypothetical protein